MDHEAIYELSEQELENAASQIREEWGPEIDARLDNLLEYRIAGAVGGVESQERQRVIIYYEPKKNFEELHAEFEQASAQSPGQEQSRNGARSSDYEFEQELNFIEGIFEEDARPLINSVRTEGGEVEEHLCFGNAVVAQLTPAQIKVIAQRPDVKRLEADKFMRLELDVSANTVGVVNARTEGLVAEGAGIIVAVIDGEVWKDHPDLQGRVVHKRNYTKEDFGVRAEDDQSMLHGTHVAGIIAGNGGTYKGMAPKATIWSYKIYPSQKTESSEGFKGADAIEDAIKDGAHIINCSWGVSGTARDGTCVWCKTAERAAKLGVVLVKSAGNSGPEQGSTTCPANALGDVIVVGNSRRDGSGVMERSSRGPTADNRIKPDILAPGEQITSTKAGGGYIKLSGTSMAAPHISGVAALMLERKRQLKPWQIKKILMDSAKGLDSSQYGPNVQGKGLIDVVKAVQTAGQVESEPAHEEDKITCTVIKLRKQIETLKTSLKNTSREIMREVRATLMSDNPGIKVTKSEGDYRTLIVGGEGVADYEVQVEPSVQEGQYQLSMDIKYTTPAGENKTISDYKVQYAVGSPPK